jgi:hypothetical protein
MKPIQTFKFVAVGPPETKATSPLPPICLASWSMTVSASCLSSACETRSETSSPLTWESL